MNGSAMAARGCAQGERGVRSQEFERCQSHLFSSRKVLPDAKSRWPGGSSTAARPAASRSWSESTLAARAEHTRSYTPRSVHSTRRTRLPAGRRAHLRAAERRQARRRCSTKRLAHPCTAAAPSRRRVCEGFVHARGAAALTRILVTWQRVQDDFLAPIRKLLPSERDIARLM